MGFGNSVIQVAINTRFDGTTPSRACHKADRQQCSLKAIYLVQCIGEDLWFYETICVIIPVIWLLRERVSIFSQSTMSKRRNTCTTCINLIVYYWITLRCTNTIKPTRTIELLICLLLIRGNTQHLIVKLYIFMGKLLKRKRRGQFRMSIFFPVWYNLLVTIYVKVIPLHNIQ